MEHGAELAGELLHADPRSGRDRELGVRDHRPRALGMQRGATGQLGRERGGQGRHGAPGQGVEPLAARGHVPVAPGRSPADPLDARLLEQPGLPQAAQVVADVRLRLAQLARGLGRAHGRPRAEREEAQAQGVGDDAEVAEVCLVGGHAAIRPRRGPDCQRLLWRLHGFDPRIRPEPRPGTGPGGGATGPAAPR